MCCLVENKKFFLNFLNHLFNVQVFDHMKLYLFFQLQELIYRLYYNINPRKPLFLEKILVLASIFFSYNFPFQDLYSKQNFLSNLIWFVCLFNGGFKMNLFSLVKKISIPFIFFLFIISLNLILVFLSFSLSKKVFFIIVLLRIFLNQLFIITEETLILIFSNI